MDNKNGAVNQSVERACYILELFTPLHPEWSLKELAEACSIAVTTVMPLLKALENAGFLERHPDTKKYQLGMKFIEKGQQVLAGIDIRELALRPTKALAVQFEATVHLGVLDGAEVIIIDRQDMKRELLDTMYPAYVGKRLPADRTALGLVLSAYAADTPTDKQKEIQQNGYAIDDELHQPNGLCVAAPLFLHNGKVCAALSLSMIKSDARMQQLPEIITAVKQAAQTISQKMGYRT